MLFQFLFRTASYNSKFRRRKFADIRFMFCQFFKKTLTPVGLVNTIQS